MKRFLPLILLVSTPVVGIAAGTVIAWQKYPKSASRDVGQQFEDVSARGKFMIWGGIAGAAVGVLGAAGLTVTRRPAPNAKHPEKSGLRCPSCGARHPDGP